MAIDQAESAARWIDAANRLREVRDAERRFLDLWNFEQAEPEARELSQLNIEQAIQSLVEATQTEEPAHEIAAHSSRWSNMTRNPRRRR